MRCYLSTRPSQFVSVLTLGRRENECLQNSKLLPSRPTRLATETVALLFGRMASLPFIESVLEGDPPAAGDKAESPLMLLWDVGSGLPQ